MSETQELVAKLKNDVDAQPPAEPSVVVTAAPVPQPAAPADNTMLYAIGGVVGLQMIALTVAVGVLAVRR